MNLRLAKTIVGLSSAWLVTGCNDRDLLSEKENKPRAEETRRTSNPQHHASDRGSAATQTPDKFQQIRKLLASDPVKALSLLNELNLQERQSPEAIALFGENFGSYPEIFASYLDSVSQDGLRKSYLYSAIHHSGHTDFQDLLALIRKLPASSHRDLHERLLRQCARNEPERIEQLIDLLDPELQEDARSYANLFLPSSSLQDKLEALSNVREKPTYNRLLTEILQNGDRAIGAAELLQASANLSPQDRMALIATERFPLANLSEAEITAIFQIFDSIPATKTASETISSVISKIAESDPKRSFEYLSSRSELTVSHELLAALAGLTSIKGGNDQFIRSQLHSENVRAQEAAAHHIGFSAATGGVSETKKKLEGIPEGLRNSFAEGAIEMLFIVKPDEVASLFQDESEILPYLSQAKRDKILKAVVSNVWNQGEAEAVTYIDTLSSSSDRVAASREISKLWLAEDPESFSQWLVDRPPSEERDVGITMLVEEIQDSDPDAAVEWKRHLFHGKP